MRISKRLLWIPLCLMAMTTGAEEPVGYAHARPTENPTALDRYVAKPDPNYRWELVRTDKEDGLTSYTLDMVSQQWRSLREVNRPIWQHWVTIAVPDELKAATALLYVDGGFNNKGSDPPGSNNDFKRIARNTGTVTASIYQIPNQSLVFTDMKGWPRFEDSLIAYTWWKFFQTGDEEWPLRLPMTKATVRAMDAIQEFCHSKAGGEKVVNDFVVVGGSKRGWTTWTTAIVDSRVRAIAPCAIDNMNGIVALRHHWAAYGHWSAAFGDYESLGLDDWLETPENAALMEIIDPYHYLDRLQMPKYIMYAANDQFFVPDTTQYWWEDVQGPKWLRQIPNANHWLDDTAVPSVAAFYSAIVSDTPLPEYAFAFEDDGAIVVTLNPSADGAIIRPTSVKLWQAHNPKERDARGAMVKFEASDLAPTEPNVYRATVSQEETGYVFYLVELTYPGSDPETPFRVTSGCRVTPKESPFQYIPPANPPQGFLNTDAKRLADSISTP